MKIYMMLAHAVMSARTGAIWGFVALVLLILFLTLVVNEGSKDKDK